MSDLIALEVSLAEDLLPLSQYLWRHGVAHRIVENEGRRILLVRQLDQIDGVREVYARLRRGEALPEQPQLPKTQRRSREIGRASCRERAEIAVAAGAVRKNKESVD